MLKNNNEEFEQHLSDGEIQKLRNVIKTRIAGELTIKSSHLERILHLAGQNMTKMTVNRIQKILEDTYQTDEYFLDDIETILASFWEELTDDEIIQLLIESFEIFDENQQGFLMKNDLIKYLTQYGDMPLNKKDFQIMFSMVNNIDRFNYEEFVRKLCLSKSSKKKKKKMKRTIKIK